MKPFQVKNTSRSILGGFIKWNKGSAQDGSDSYAMSIADKKSLAH